MKKIFSGVCTALVTPFKDGKVDFEAFKVIIEAQIFSGVSALLFLGTTGESATMAECEKREIIRFAIAYVNNRVPLIFGAGGNNPTDIIALGKFIKDAAAEQKHPDTKDADAKIICEKHADARKNTTPKTPAIMVSAPYYNKCTQSGAVVFFNHIANEVKLPMIVYNVPGRTGMNLESQTMAQIAQNKYIRGIKEASGNIEQIARTVSLCPDTPVYSGDDAICLPCYAVGCAGIISVASNVMPNFVCQIWLAYKKNKNDTAAQMYRKQLPLYKALFCEVNPIPIKFAMAHRGFCKNEVRLPLTPLTPENEKTVAALLDN